MKLRKAAVFCRSRHGRGLLGDASWHRLAQSYAPRVAPKNESKRLRLLLGVGTRCIISFIVRRISLYGYPTFPYTNGRCNSPLLVIGRLLEVNLRTLLFRRQWYDVEAPRRVFSRLRGPDARLEQHHINPTDFWSRLSKDCWSNTKQWWRPATSTFEIVSGRTNLGNHAPEVTTLGVGAGTSARPRQLSHQVCKASRHRRADQSVY